MVDALRHALEGEPGIAYALLFGSSARGPNVPGATPTWPSSSRLELRGTPRHSAVSPPGWSPPPARRVDLVLLDEAPAPLAYRIFRDGRVLVERDRAALVARKARAILDYLDFRPVEELCAAGVLRAAARGR